MIRGLNKVNCKSVLLIILQKQTDIGWKYNTTFTFNCGTLVLSSQLVSVRKDVQKAVYFSSTDSPILVRLSRYKSSSIMDDMVHRDTCKPFVKVYNSLLIATFTTRNGTRLKILNFRSFCFQMNFNLYLQ